MEEAAEKVLEDSMGDDMESIGEAVEKVEKAGEGMAKA